MVQVDECKFAKSLEYCQITIRILNMGNNGWKCQCGHINEPEFTMCLLCGRSKSQAVQQIEKPSRREITQPVNGKTEQKTEPKKQAVESRQWAGQKQRFNVDKTISRMGKIDWK